MKLSLGVSAAVLGCAGLAIAGAAQRASRAHRGSAETPAALAPEGPAAAASNAGSLYDLDLHLTGADGRPLAPERLRGHPVLAGMFFAACPSACPLLIRDLAQMAAALPARDRADLRILLVSFDPARDTPAVLADVLRRHDLAPESWLLAAPPDDDGARLAAAALGIRYRRTADGQFEHTRRVTLLDREGRVRAQSDDPRTLAAALRALPAAH